jgi:hypothetical protein
MQARANAENNLAFALMNPIPTGRPATGFGADDGASLLMAFRGLQAESVAQGKAHKTISNELNTLVADPFEHWAVSHSVITLYRLFAQQFTLSVGPYQGKPSHCSRGLA